MTASSSTLTKRQIADQARDFGAEFVGFAPVERWQQASPLPPEGHPLALWPLTKTVIVLGVPLWLPIVEASPSELGREQYLITDRLLDEVSYRLSLYLNRHGHASINLPRDGQGEPEVLGERLTPVFSHTQAGYLAGLGRIGRNQALLTQAFGPRQRWISVFTDLALEGDPLLEGDPCGDCRNCETICPVGALSQKSTGDAPRFDAAACAANGQRLREAFRNPCGFCLKVCPVGDDRGLFGGAEIQKYFEEARILASDPYASEYRHWLHIRKYGGRTLPEDPSSLR